MPNVSIKLLREGAKLPVRGSASAAGYDLYACLDGDQELTIPPHSTAMLLHAVDSYVTPIFKQEKDRVAVCGGRGGWEEA